MTTERKYFSGNTLEIALMQAARHHGLQPEEVAYRKIEKRHGFLRARRGVVIEVDPNAPRQGVAEPPVEEEAPIQRPPVEEEAPIERPPAEDRRLEPRAVVESAIPLTEPEEAIVEELADSAEPAPVIAEPGAAIDADDQAQEPTAELIEAARRGLREILEFAKLDLGVRVSEGEGQLEIELSGPDRDRLVEDRGNLLLAIQHLLPRLIRGYTGRSIPCHVDSEDFHASREAELKKLAEEAAREVCDRQQPRTLPPMNPAERRIVHVVLAEQKEVTTESQGKGFFKRVTISPATRRPRGFDRY